MRYVSTRGEAPELDFSEVLLTGLARDGGLYIPKEFPQLSVEEIAGFAGKPYSEVALKVIAPFVGDSIPYDDLKEMIEEAYASFSHEAVTPLVQTAPNTYVLELFHGPTLAFKDVAMQLLGRLMDYVLAKKDARATIIGATSGDTGGAAIEAFRGRERTDVFILFPEGRVSSVQQRQMTTAKEANIHALAINGNFDDCQGILKDLFNNFPFRERVGLSGVNSINWARIVAQVTYYFTAAVSLGAPHRKVSFTVPTGNFGDVFAGYVAAQMGLPIEKLVIATNTNDILARTLETGRYETRGVVATTAPSMDIQVSSNFERLLFAANDKDGATVKSQMDSLKQSGGFSLSEKALGFIKQKFEAGRASEEETAQTIAETLKESGYLLDPHTAVAIHVAKSHSIDEIPMIVLSTAHPAKFPAAVENACGVNPDLPAHLSDLMTRTEKFDVLPADALEVAKFVEGNARAVKAGV
ncbi:Threonine synthase [Pseudovibrio axinellae]|uniref:Threonine synthase n=1 Tax=Pseudovibrio axinellae TaxID=989403 RepID=A0A165YE84_9HYPH|nr:threonine synthase [Pseudovibrio axinellae]KZL18765.1 Threonine synthase [Pseudovibrio axinellae]SEP93643.1 L-threonine synthase [Pseudovibrio axinellae]